MSQQTINIGASPNDGTGDTLRAGGQKINANFTELYGMVQDIGGGGMQTVTLLVSDPNGDALTTGDGKAYFRVPSTLDGFELIEVAAAVTTASSSGSVSVQIHNVTQTADMLSTPLTIDASETDSSTAAAPAVVDDAESLVSTADMLRIDVDGAGTGAKGLIVEMQFGYLS